MPPLLGSEAAETSAIARFAQPVSKVDAAASGALYVEQPDPAPFHTDSDQPRAVPGAVTSEVPPTVVV